MKITRIKEIHWWDPKTRQDTITYKVWLDVQGRTELRWFDQESELSRFVATLKKAKRR